MQRPENLNVPLAWNIRAPINDNELYVKMAVEHWENRTVSPIKNAIREDRNPTVPALSGMNKFTLILMLLMRIEDGRDARVFADLPNICKNPRKLSFLMEYVYDVFREVVGNGNLPNIAGFQLPNVERTIIATLRTTDVSIVIPSNVAKTYAYTVAFYLNWAQLNGSFPTNRYYRAKLVSIYMGQNVNGDDTDISDDEGGTTTRVPRSVPEARRQRPQPPRVQQAVVVNTHLKDSYFSYYHLAVSNNCCKAEDCTICLEPMIYDPNNKKELKLTDCGHMFHTKCIARWRKPECPVCRWSMQRTATSRNTDAVVRMRDLTRAFTNTRINTPLYESITPRERSTTLFQQNLIDRPRRPAAQFTQVMM